MKTRRPLFTAEELEELKRIDVELEAAPVSNEEVAQSRERDRMAVRLQKDKKAYKLAEYQRRYREANKDKLAEYKRRYRARKKALKNEQEKQECRRGRQAGRD